jgi:hypothetical protein
MLLHEKRLVFVDNNMNNNNNNNNNGHHDVVVCYYVITIMFYIITFILDCLSCFCLSLAVFFARFVASY